MHALSMDDIPAGDRIRVTNRLPESTTIHWHGLRAAEDLP